MTRTDPMLPIVVLIPAYKPDERLVALCQALQANDLPILVVDDGSGPQFQPVFERAQAFGATVARHAVNLGKGRALKTGINIILQRWPSLAGVVTADADGQHAPEDIGRVMAAMREHPDALILGARAFSGNVPVRSRVGNTITRYVYQFASGMRCTDTQTGLRGLPATALPLMMQIRGERYEYEMDMLLRLRDMNLALFEVPIQTIYYDNNRGSHFSALRDASRVFLVILRYLAVSILSFCIDYGLYLLLLRISGIQPWMSYILARIGSGLFNFSVNRIAVFNRRGGKLAVVRYFLLAVVLFALSLLLLVVRGLWNCWEAGSDSRSASSRSRWTRFCSC
ncbi:MAG TPA: bifunctional glycosyltransferase family 2/GtrA family protein [Clostridia bacterium]|nr:bifunctional glycosyltransferase family 2/GtrA family protein [Clostridia bacterium]